jgi:hypothetical protein
MKYKSPRSPLPWGLLFRGRFLKGYPSLNKLLTDTSSLDWSDYTAVAPNGVKLSIEVARMI